MYRILVATSSEMTGRLLTGICRSLKGVRTFGPVKDLAMLKTGVGDGGVDLLILGSSSPFQDPDLVSRIRRRSPETEVALLQEADDHASGRDMVRAMARGAWEWLDGTALDSPIRQRELGHRLTALVGMLRSRKLLRLPRGKQPRNRFFIPCLPQTRKIRSFGGFRARVVALAASTGGPEILSNVLPLLPASLPAPVLVVQHMPRGMCRHLVRHLDRQCEMNVRLGAEGMELKAGGIYIAPTGYHMGIYPPDGEGEPRIHLGAGPRINGVKPSADYLFSSMATAWPSGILAVVLTGMGTDGKNGVAALKQHANVCLTQAAETCSVYGMPRAVDEAGLSDAKLDPVSITHRIVSLCNTGVMATSTPTPR
ncbi:MAG: hypothetical protein MI747_17765 [Desulfobacterales bacterium]|nr:hypothetical protein [Desulfobacterales bacterium]